MTAESLGSLEVKEHDEHNLTSGYQLTFDGVEEAYEDTPLTLKKEGDNFLPTTDELVKPIGERIPTPLDSRGLVDILALIDVVVEYVEPGYEWRGHTDMHHLYWFSSIYSDNTLLNRNPDVARKFRAMPLHMIELPVGLHRFLHKVTLPVEAPELQVMVDRMESWRVAKELFNSVKIIRNRKFLTNEEAARRVNREMLRNKFSKIEQSITDIAKIPDEFVFFDTKPFEEIVGAGKVEHVRVRDLEKAYKQLRGVGAATHKRALGLDNKGLMAA